MGNVVVDAIMQATSDSRTRMAMLMGSKLESGWNPESVGDHGTSFGPFQIHLPAHPGVSAAQAKDPVFAAKYMAGAYQQGVNKVNPGLWNSDPAMAAATAAFYAERPAVMYPTSRYRAAWSEVSAALSGAPVGTGNGMVPAGNPVSDTVSGFTSFFGDTFNHIMFGLLMAGGVIVMGVGLYLFAKETSIGRGVSGGIGKTGKAFKIVTIGSNND